MLTLDEDGGREAAVNVREAADGPGHLGGVDGAAIEGRSSLCAAGLHRLLLLFLLFEFQKWLRGVLVHGGAAWQQRCQGFSRCAWGGGIPCVAPAWPQAAPLSQGLVRTRHLSCMCLS
jgi:hypothetical protein